MNSKKTLEELKHALEIFKEHKELKSKLGGCPPDEYRINANCFHCDECWISSLEQIIKEKEK